MNEFDLIAAYFKAPTCTRADVAMGIGDDCALLLPHSGKQLAVTTDTLVAGVHFFENMPPQDLGYKALAVNLSDLAAMGAWPAWMTLALTLPEVNTAWLEGFSSGLFELANKYQVQLVGGDTTRGPLSITLTLMGWVGGHPITRAGALPGHGIYVTGKLGSAARAVKALYANQAPHPADLHAFYRPEPRLQEAQHFAHLVSAGIDISDGLAADLGHILIQSQVGATLEVSALRAMLDGTGDTDWETLLYGGEDYELCITLPDPCRAEAEEKLSQPLIRIGVIEALPGLRLRDGDSLEPIPLKGYQHFT